MQFQVPQFIEVEDKIFGPLTFKQFVFLGGGAGIAYMLWRLLPLLLAGPFIALVGALAVALAFAQYNGRPFIVAIEHAFYYGVRSKLYLWNNAYKKATVETRKAALPAEEGEVYIPRLSDSKLHELAWSLDIKERIAAGVANDDERHVKRTAEDLVTIHTAEEARI
ncbi:PrgI family protein [Candidatus Kaiserbacteria bacterium]|nr:PrgI family protein [Candidatus Kaiserbacteria bacterium]